MASVTRVLATISLGLILVVVTEGLHLPAYIKPCSRSDPKLNECAKRHALLAIPNLIKGDKTLRSPPISPLKLKEVKLDNAGVNMRFTDIVVMGLADLEITEVHIDENKKEWQFDGKVPRINFDVTYDMDGRILILPIKGHGPGNITFTDIKFMYKFTYELFDKEGTTFGKALTDTMEFTTGKNYFQLDNLFNGDKRLGDEMNKFLNENPDEVTKIIEPAVTGTISKIIFNIADNILKTVPYDEIILP